MQVIMTKAISIFRILALISLFMTAVVLFLCQETSDDLGIWLIKFIFNKSVAIGLIYLTARTYKRWRQIDPWLAVYGRWCDEVDETPNRISIHNNNKD